MHTLLLIQENPHHVTERHPYPHSASAPLGSADPCYPPPPQKDSGMPVTMVQPQQSATYIRGLAGQECSPYTTSPEAT